MMMYVLFGGMLGAAIYCAIRKKAFMQMADTACMGLVIAQIIGRWGDFFNRESFGEYTNSILQCSFLYPLCVPVKSHPL